MSALDECIDWTADAIPLVGGIVPCVADARSELTALRARVAELEGRSPAQPAECEHEAWEECGGALRVCADCGKELNTHPARPAECERCDGAGWVWRHELDTPVDWDDPTTDDTRYSCPDCQPAQPAPASERWTDQDRFIAFDLACAARKVLDADNPGVGWSQGKVTEAENTFCAAIAKVAPKFVRVKLPPKSDYMPGDREKTTAWKVARDATLWEVECALRSQGIEVSDE